MSEWAKPLGDVAEVAMGQSPPGNLVTERGDGLPFLQGNAEFGEHHPTARLQCDAAARRASRSDVLISVRAPVGALNRADRTYGIGRGVAAVAFTRLDPAFGYHALRHSAPDLHRVSQGTTFAAIGTRGLLELRLPAPMRDEQRRIAEILDTLDEAIAEADRLEAKTEQTREALALQLLTGAEQPMDDSINLSTWRLGRLGGVAQAPSGWKLVQLTSVATLESGHTPARTVPTYWGGEVPWLSLHDTKRLNGRAIRTTSLSITEAGIRSSSARLLPEGTVALSRTATIGKSVLLGRPMATSQDFACYVPGDGLHGRFLLHLFRRMGGEWQRLAAGSTHQTIYMPIFRRLQILLPPLDYQVGLAKVLDAADEKEDADRLALDKLRALRAGLADDLLSGRVRTVSA